MKLNRVEKALMNNPARAAIQRYHEAALMIRLMRPERLQGLRVLEIGCGRGVGTEIIFKQFGAAEIDAFDVDPAMISLARRRLVHNPKRLRLFVGDATAIEATDHTYDAVVDFGIIHHVPVWQKAVAEVSRVLKPEGVFLFEEVTRQALSRWFYRTFLKHPPPENWFTADEFVKQVEVNGIAIGNNRLNWFFGDFVVGIGRKSLDRNFGKQSSTFGGVCL
jgi:ubiquinone/menaquinone biosynthesis C-methylase UbiE